MKINILFIAFIFTSHFIFAQNAATNSGGQVVTVQPKIMVIPFTKEGEDMRTILEADPVKRIVISKVKEAFDKRGFTTVDFLAKLKAAKEQNIWTSTNQSDIKSQLINFAGPDIYVEADVNQSHDGKYNGIQLILTGNESSTGNSLANKTCSSGTFETEDYGVLGMKAAEKIADEFLNVMQLKFYEMIENGKSIAVNISFDQNSAHKMSSEIGSTGLPLSDVLEEWMGKNAYKNNYHPPSVSDLTTIFDDVRIPLKDQATKQNYSPNKFALLLFQYIKSLGLTPAKDIKGNTIYITIK